MHIVMFADKMPSSQSHSQTFNLLIKWNNTVGRQRPHSRRGVDKQTQLLVAAQQNCSAHPAGSDADIVV